MRRDVRAQCCALLIAAVAGCFVASCATKREGRWVEPQAVLGFSSVEEITNKFASYELIKTHGMRSREVSAKDAHFLFVTTIPYSNSSLLNTYCFEQIEPDFWQLRAMLVFARVKNVDLDFVTDGDSVKLISEGKTLFSVASMASAHSGSP